MEKNTYDLHRRSAVLQQLPKCLWAMRTARHATRHPDDSDSIVSHRVHISTQGRLEVRARIHRSVGGRQRGSGGASRHPPTFLPYRPL